MTMLAALIASLVAVAFIVNTVRGVTRRHKAAASRRLAAGTTGATGPTDPTSWPTPRTERWDGRAAVASHASSSPASPSRRRCCAPRRRARPRPRRDGRRAGADLGDDLHARPRQVARPRRRRADREEHEAGPRPPDAERHAHDPLLLRVGDDRRPARGDRGRGVVRQAAPRDDARAGRRLLAARRSRSRPTSTSARPRRCRSPSTCRAGAPRSESDDPGRVGVRDVRPPGRSATAATSGSSSRRASTPSATGSPTQKSVDAGAARSRRPGSPTPADWYASSTRTARPRSRATGSTSPAASISSSAPGPRTPSGRRRVTGLLRTGLPELVDKTGPRLAGDGRPRGHRGPHAAARGLRRHLPRPASDQIEISEDLDDLTIIHEASHAWFNEQPVRRPLDQRGPGRRVRLAGPRRGLGRRAGPRPGLADRRRGGPAQRLDVPRPDHRRGDRGPRDSTATTRRGRSIRALVDGRGRGGDAGRPRRREPPRRSRTSGRARPRRSPDAADWRRLLDLLDERGGATRAPTRPSGAGS